MKIGATIEFACQDGVYEVDAEAYASRGQPSRVDRGLRQDANPQPDHVMDLELTPQELEEEEEEASELPNVRQ
eukprot:5048724-Amphidinium_carterae.1